MGPLRVPPMQTRTSTANGRGGTAGFCVSIAATVADGLARTRLLKPDLITPQASAHTEQLS
jgi:hypothetical protein